MRKASRVGLVAVGVVAVVALLGCKKDDPPAQTPGAGATAYPGQAGYGQQPGYGAAPAGYGTAPGAAVPPQGGPVTPGAAPTPGAPAAAGGMAVPGPLAFPCTSDATCGTSHCNTQYGKCAFPCQSDVDCIQNTHCIAGMGICAMKPPGQ